jgi:valyl-tRNA synthetase
MENIQPWCISRQIWWGHQIPAWYGPKRTELGFEFGDLKRFVEQTESDVIEAAKRYYKHKVVVVLSEREAIERWNRAAEAGGEALSAIPIWRDEDVLDTWFSSALWPFSTLGWPDETPELKRFYPTSTLVTGFDIIFFWVARMMMMGLHFLKEVPFRDVYIHALVRDERGQKMSKSKGNVIDPLQVIDEYGADALRFTLAAMAAQGRDIKLSQQRVEGYRNFATKLWNAARFAEINNCFIPAEFSPSLVKEPLNRWILDEVERAIAEVTTGIQAYRFNEAANAIYRFVWNIYCDWYLELVKPILLSPNRAARAETSAMVAWVRDQILKLLHPFMPFVTEELWQITSDRTGLLALTPWPIAVDGGPRRRKSLARKFLSRLQKMAFSRGISFGGDLSAVAEIGFIVGLIAELRSARMEFDVPARSISLVRAINYNRRSKRWIQKYQKEISRLCNCHVDLFDKRLVISGDPDVPEELLKAVREQELLAHVVLPYREGQLLLHGIDRARQKTKYEHELEKLDADIARVDAKLGNPNFVARAPEDVVEEEKEKREAAAARKVKIAEALQRLEGAA